MTSFLEMPNTKPSTSTQALLDDKLQRAASKSLVNYGFFRGTTAENLEDFRYSKIGSLVQVNPSWRSLENNQLLWQTLLDNYLIIILYCGKNLKLTVAGVPLKVGI